tara:strand:+ start:2736 stop:4208 length:1473 start_codon:yes stop_codon:yes gene_type:complete
LLKIFDHKQKNQEILEKKFSSDAFYLYHDKKKNLFLYSDNLNELINSKFLPSKLEINHEAINHLFLTSIVPPPLTVYKNLFKIGHGIKVKLYSEGSLIGFKFYDENNELKIKSKNIFEEKDEAFILQKLYEEIELKKDKSLNDLLFQSSGKDSNMIAISYSLFGKAQNLTCLTYNEDEIYFAKKISDKLGIKHIPLKIHDLKEDEFENKLLEKMENSFFPNTDNAFLGYFFYNDGLLNTPHNLIDGMGNDIYIGHVPKKREFYMQYFSNFFSKFNFITNYTNSILINEILKKKVFWTGLVGLPLLDNKKILNNFNDESDFYENKISKNDDYFKIRSKIRGRYVDLEKFITKLQCYSQIVNSKAIFPWTNSELATYFLNLNDQYLFDKRLLKNKLILRKILEKRLSIDFDKIGKKDFKFNYWKLMNTNKKFVINTIINCSLFTNKNYLKSLIEKLFSNALKNNLISNRSKTLINQIFQICIWYNNSKYIKK